MPTSDPPSRGLDVQFARFVFPAVLLFHFSFTFWQIASHRISSGHDGQQLLMLQHYFLNDRIASGEMPLWMPYMSHGTVSTWWYSVQAFKWQNALLFSGWIPSSANFFYVYHVGILLEELFFLVGMRLLAGKYIASPLALFFTLIAVSGSMISVDQPWFNLSLVSSVPMLLYLLHHFIDTYKSLYLVLACNLLFLQLLGGLPYFLPMFTFVVFLYFVLWFATSRGDLRRMLAGVVRWRTLTLAALSLTFSAIPVYLAMTLGTEEIVSYNIGRDASGKVSQESFLTYGGQINFGKWLELAFGFSPYIDYTLYVGIACLPLAAVAVLAAFRKTLPLTGTFLVLVLLSAGAFPAAIVYYWPMMSYFRHIGLIGALARIFLILLAGCGFEALLTPRKSSLFGAIAVCGGVLAALLWLATDARARLWALDASLGFTPSNSIFLRFVADDGKVVDRLIFTVLCAIAALFLLLLMWLASSRWMRPLLATLAIVQAIDIASYKSAMLAHKTIALSPEAYESLRFVDMPFQKQRFRPQLDAQKDPFKAALSQREQMVRESIAQRPRSAVISNFDESYGTQNWALNSFLCFDEMGSSYRIDHWLAPFDHYLRAYSGQKLADHRPPGGWLPYVGLLFPDSHAAIGKISGSDPGKIQFFARAFPAQSAERVSQIITHPQYSGDTPVLLMAPNAKESSDGRIANWDGEVVDQDSRMQLDYQILRFSSNRLEFTVENPLPVPIWLLYSDVSHPWWRAEVNGREQPIYSANLAYKAIRLLPGQNLVQFRCHAPLLAACHAVLGLFAMLWLGMLGFLTLQCILGERLSAALLTAPARWVRGRFASNGNA